MTTYEVLSIVFAALTFEAVFISAIVAIVVAITKKK
ncbi:putative holin-like toxin [Pseudoneobacillus rhizosphaerae]|nr:putative holin-like toxin [Pseudoneobacillus rhizosphaerae]